MPRLRRGKVYRTRDLARFDSNPTRLASRLVSEGRLRRLRHGLYHSPRRSVFGDIPPSEEELLRAFFADRPYLRTGPSVWNALGLGTSAIESTPLVYNTTRTGLLELDGRTFELRRVSFPKAPDLEYLVVDLLENAERAGADVESVFEALRKALTDGRFDARRLTERAREYGTVATQRLILEADEDRGRQAMRDV